MNIVSDKRRAAARKHAAKTWTCSCGKQGKGNGGWASHKKACLVLKLKRSESWPSG